MELGIVPALYLTGIKCQDRTTRCQALQLLFSANRKEWTLDSSDAAREVEKVLQLGEQGSGGVLETTTEVLVDASPLQSRC